MVSIVAIYLSIQYQSFICRQRSYYKYCYLTQIILFNTILSFTHSQIVPSIAIYSNNSISNNVWFNVSHLFANSLSCSSIWPIDKTLTGATTPSQSGTGSNSNKGELHIPQSSKTGTSPSYSFMSYSGHSLVESYHNAEMQSMYSTVPADLVVLVV